MTISVQAVKVNSSVQNANSINASRSLQNDGQTNNSPAFCGSPIVLKEDGSIVNKMKKLDGFSSAGQRLISGITGVLLQPWFDLNNKNVDQDTRTVSCARTLGKIIAGTLTGVSIRWICVKAITNFTQNNATEEELIKTGKKAGAQKITQFKKLQQCLLPEKMKDVATYKEIKKYRGALGTFIALSIMIYTNFAVDAPLTTYFTNKFVKMFTGKDPEKPKTQAKEVNNG